MKILEQCLRVYATADAIDATIAFYEQLQDGTFAPRAPSPAGAGRLATSWPGPTPSRANAFAP